MLDFLTLKPKTFGLDISDFSLKIIKLKKVGKFLSLASFGEAPIKSGIIEKGEIKDEAALARVIKTALTKVKGEKLETKYVISSLPEKKAFLQVIQLPIMKEEEAKKAVYFAAENYIPMPIEKVYLDSQIVPPALNHSPAIKAQDHIDVLIVAIPKNIVDSRLISLKKAGLKPLALEIESQSIARALVKNGISPTSLLLVDIGFSKTGLVIFSGRSLRFTDSLTVSSQKFTEAISIALKVDLKQAEKLKLRYGLTRDNPEAKKVFDALAPVLTDLIEQIKKYISYYQTHTRYKYLSPGGKAIDKIYLCGGGANLKGITDFLSLGIELPVELGNPWLNILPQPLKEVPELPYRESLKYTTALGLALKGSCPKGVARRHSLASLGIRESA